MIVLYFSCNFRRGKTCVPMLPSSGMGPILKLCDVLEVLCHLHQAVYGRQTLPSRGGAHGNAASHRTHSSCQPEAVLPPGAELCYRGRTRCGCRACSPGPGAGKPMKKGVFAFPVAVSGGVVCLCWVIGSYRCISTSKEPSQFLSEATGAWKSSGFVLKSGGHRQPQNQVGQMLEPIPPHVPSSC